MSLIEYEFPLNEKIRTYLRIESLLTRIQESRQELNPSSLFQFFNALFSIAEVIERGDLKGDLIKDMEKHEKNLITWSQHPNIDNSAIEVMLQKVVECGNRLSKSGRLGQDLKEDKFLASIKQRFSIPGGTGCFDLPHLHYWFHQDEDVQKKDISKWMSYIDLIADVINIELKFIRERGQGKQCIAKNGFFQEATENTEILKIAIPQKSAAYPTMSGNKHRFSIRFMQLDNEQGKAASEEDITFTLICC